VDILEELSRVHRTVREQDGVAEAPHRVQLERTFAAAVEDVWDACTVADRLARWFLPVTGELRLGGHFQLEGNAGGTVRQCDPPSSFTVTWEYGESTSLLTMRLTPEENITRLQLTHSVADDDHWRTYGPGAVGVGWDLALLGLTAHLAAETLPEADLAATPEGQDFVRRSAASWGDAHASGGAAVEQAEAAARRTSDAYAPG
jgi:uncharacterized protein YndB with AHSA1/START domain